MAGDEKPQRVRRQQPFDGLVPADFVENGNWPNGRLVTPRLLSERLNPGQLKANMRVVVELRRLVQDYEMYLVRARTTQQAVAKQLAVSADSLSSLRNGTAFPGLRIKDALRLNIPTEEQMRQGKLTVD